MSEEIAQRWLRQAAATANSKDFKAHMELISKRVNLVGVPGTVEGNDGTVNAQGIEVLLEKEQDGQWRLVQERVTPG